MRIALPAFALVSATLLVGLPASAQFRLDNAPSGVRKMIAEEMKGTLPVKDKPDLSTRAKPITSLGTAQTESLASSYARAAPIAPTQAFNGAGTTTTAIQDKSLDDPSQEDPLKPRQPLKPSSLKKGVAPRK